VRVSDPLVGPEILELFPQVDPYDWPYAAASAADVVVILNEDYGDLDLLRLRRAMAGNTLIDFRNLYEPQAVAEQGLRYVSLGRPTADRTQEQPRSVSDRGSANGVSRAGLIATHQPEEQQI
jgi:UDPglucose 6-dehydrogenase